MTSSQRVPFIGTPANRSVGRLPEEEEEVEEEEEEEELEE